MKPAQPIDRLSVSNIKSGPECTSGKRFGQHARISLSKRKTALAHSSRVEGRSVSRAIWRQLGNVYIIAGLCQNLQRTLA